MPRTVIRCNRCGQILEPIDRGMEPLGDFCIKVNPCSQCKNDLETAHIDLINNIKNLVADDPYN